MLAIFVIFSSAETEEASRSRVEALVQAWRKRPWGEPSALPHPPTVTPTAAIMASVSSPCNRGATLGWPRQLRLLLVRSWRQVVRDKETIISRAMTNISR